MKKTKTIALVGNPNSGKTTLFNLLTKSGEPCGNRAGVTFSAKKAPLRKFSTAKDAYIMDLPGIYSLSSCTNEEKATQYALQNEDIDVLLHVVDATCLERALLLTCTLISRGIPTVIALNMMDEVKKAGITIDIPKLSQTLGVPIIPISAAKAIGIEALIEACLKNETIPVPLIFAGQQECHIYIRKILSECVKKSTTKHGIDDKIDHLICRPFIGIPLFFLVMSLVFFLTFSSLGAWASAWLETIFEVLVFRLKGLLQSMNVHPFLCRFLTDGVWKGISSVLSFIPQTAILFCLLAVLEDSGYLSRAAFVMDSVMRPLGVSGKAIIPMLIGFGCTVPAVMSTVTLDDREKKAVAASLPFVPCSARLPVIVMISSAFFPNHRASFAVLLYLICMLVTLLSLLICRRAEPASPLILELPKYRLPHMRSLVREVRNKLRDFIIRAGTVVFLSCIAVDLLAMLKPDLTPAVTSEESILAHLGNIAAPLLRPLGFSDGRLISALAAGFFAKESIVSAIQMLIPEGIASVLSPAGACSFAVFSLLYLPCAATLAAIKQEFGIKKALKIALRALLFAFVCSYLIYTFVRILSN